MQAPSENLSIATGERKTTTANTATAASAIPTVNGAAPRRVRVWATHTAYVRLAPSAALAVATTNDCPVGPSAPVILAVGGNTHYSVIDDGTVAKVSITPLAN